MQTSAARKQKAALLSILSNGAQVVGKLVVGTMSGSVAVVSEAVHSATDLVASVIAYLSVQASDTPPDEDHPFGHGKIESISSLAEAVLIFAAGLYVIYEAVLKLNANHPAPANVKIAIGVMGFSALSNFFLARHLRRVGLETDSQALVADAHHLNTDVLTSVGVFTGLILTHFTRLPWLDPVTGLVVAGLILRAGYLLCRDSILPLMDTRLPVSEEDLIRQVLNDEPRVLGYHKLRTRKSGSQRHVDIHVQIDDECTLVEAHDFTEELEDMIRKVLPALFINIHIEPYQAEMRHQLEAHGLTPQDINQKLRPQDDSSR